MMLLKLGVAGLMSLMSLFQCAGGNSSPTISCRTMYDSNTGPDRGNCAIWGASGYVQMEVVCWNPAFGFSDGFTGNPTWFAGGGDSLHPGMFLATSCPWIMPELVTHYGWSWG